MKLQILMSIYHINELHVAVDMMTDSLQWAHAQSINVDFHGVRGFSSSGGDVSLTDLVLLDTRLNSAHSKYTFHFYKVYSNCPKPRANVSASLSRLWRDAELSKNEVISKFCGNIPGFFR